MTMHSSSGISENPLFIKLFAPLLIGGTIMIVFLGYLLRVETMWSLRPEPASFIWWVNALDSILIPGTAGIILV